MQSPVKIVKVNIWLFTDLPYFTMKSQFEGTIFDNFVKII